MLPPYPTPIPLLPYLTGSSSDAMPASAPPSGARNHSIPTNASRLGQGNHPRPSHKMTLSSFKTGRSPSLTLIHNPSPQSPPFRSNGARRKTNKMVKNSLLLQHSQPTTLSCCSSRTQHLACPLATLGPKLTIGGPSHHGHLIALQVHHISCHHHLLI